MIIIDRAKKLIFLFLILIILISSVSVNAISIQKKIISPPGLPNFYVNNDWKNLENGTIVIDEFIIDYIIGENAFAKIQDAIDKASYHDLIFVFQGIYNENILIEENKEFVELRGIYGWQDPDPMGENIINGGSKKPIITIKSNYIKINGFIITNINNESDGIICESNYCKIYDNTFTKIGGIGVNLKSTTIGNKVYHNNFIENGQNAQDNSKTNNEAINSWYLEEQGNYWDDHPKGLKRNKYVWLKPYKIPGAAESVDIYPWIREDGKTKIKTNSLFTYYIKILKEMIK